MPSDYLKSAKSMYTLPNRLDNNVYLEYYNKLLLKGGDVIDIEPY